ncbi:MAG: hypothetical protein Q8Q81_19585 [Oxalobacteraceae bacterium]|nr:hypothetical protein [Oxalobacteraceae bacterium]
MLPQNGSIRLSLPAQSVIPAHALTTVRCRNIQITPGRCQKTEKKHVNLSIANVTEVLRSLADLNARSAQNQLLPTPPLSGIKRSDQIVHRANQLGKHIEINLRHCDEYADLATGYECHVAHEATTAAAFLEDDWRVVRRG